MQKKIQILWVSLGMALLTPALAPALAQQPGSPSSGTAAQSASPAASTDQSNQKLADILLRRGVISQDEYNQLTGQKAGVPVPAASPAPALPSPAAISSVPEVQAETQHPSAATTWLNPEEPPYATEPGAPSFVERVPSTTVNEALSPIRVFPIGGLQIDEHPAFKADGVGITPYGFIKATFDEDSSSPNGDDFPLPGFLTDTGPNGSPEFHVKARSTRFGANFQWFDHNPKWVVTGKIEMDFEGNFNRSDNRNLSSLRSSNPGLRLAYVRMDYHFNANNTFSAVFGQDWTTYGSSTLPNILETTGLGVAFGSMYERDPQMRAGFTHKMGGLSITPEFAFDMPFSGLPPANVAQQLGYGERQGPDSNRPEYQGRLVLQWQLDHAKGVPPAQLIFSGFEGRRAAIVLASGVPTAYATTFSTGVEAGSKQDGWDFEWQLPSRWFTLVGKFYSGADLRYFFAGQLYSFYNDTKGLTNTVVVPSEDGASNVIFGTTAGGVQVTAPQRPVRSEGGFAQLGLPLSRIFNADPAGRNAGWSLYATYGVDQAKTRDLDEVTLKGNRRYSTMAIGTLNYKLNRWLAFSYEQSLYTTHANPEEPLPLFRGVPSREWNDVREEGGPIFTF